MLRLSMTAALAFLVGCAAPAELASPAGIDAGTQPADRLMARANVIDIRDGTQLRQGSWTLTREADPDVYTVQLGRSERREVCFISGPESLCRTVGEGDSHDFIVSFEGFDYPHRIVGRYVPPMAVFDSAYQAAHRDKVTVVVPEVYELVNVAIALTPLAREERFLVMKETSYYRDLVSHFAPLANHPLVLALEQRMRANRSNYFHLKMNAYAFDYDSSGDIVRNPIYDRTGFRGQAENTLLPLLEEMRSFSRQSRFREFYARHRPLYEEQIEYFRNDINVARMVDWLKRHFPAVRPYDHIKIVFSPLVFGSQSVTWIDNGGFTELQPHVNFPYPQNFTLPVSEEARALQRGNLLFTEINHGFINPTAEENYAEEVVRAMGDRARWVAQNSTTASYGSSMAVFNEMMNWVLVDLFYVDMAPPGDLERLLEANRANQTEGRGFIRFREFSQFLVPLYRTRPAGTTIADLYPQIVRWFDQRRQSGHAVAEDSDPSG